MSTLMPPEAIAALESMRADAARAAAAAQQAAAAAQQAAQGIQRGGTGIQQIGQNAPTIAEGIQRGGTGIQRVGETGLSQASQAIRYASDQVRGASADTNRWLQAALAVLVGTAVGATILAVVVSRKRNRRPRRRRAP